MIPSINPLVLNLKESATLHINTTVKKLRSEGRKVNHFGFGEAAFPVPKLLQEGLIDHASHNEYLPTQGLLELREALCAYLKKEHQLEYTAEDVFIGPGSKELIFQLSYLVEGILLVPAPSWVSYGPQAAMRGKTLIPIQTKRENSYRLQADELDRACFEMGQEQKLLILNNPNNPTGSVYTEEELKEIAEICRAYNVIVISDEIYAGIDFTGRPHVSIARFYPEGTIVSTGLSKLFAGGGYRLGAMIIPPTLQIIKDSLSAIISETFSCVSCPVQYAALNGYSRFDELREELNTNRDIYRYASEYLWDRFTAMGLNCPKPEGAFYLFPDFDNYREKLKAHGILTGKALVEKLLLDVGVALLPGSDFYFPATNLGVRTASVDFDGKFVRENWPGRDGMNEEWEKKLFPSLIEGCDRLEAFLKNL
ncbi:MAG: pyridoxal phosphate-dependent aminotransferase [Spirochaetaceae bacterium]